MVGGWQPTSPKKSTPRFAGGDWNQFLQRSHVQFLEISEVTSAKADPRAFSKQHADLYQLARCIDSDRLMTSRFPGSSSKVAASIATEGRGTWYCDADMNPFNHPTIAQYLFSTPEFARAHSSRICAVTILFAGRNWAVADRQDL
jgi:hypothetical protein